MPLFDAVADLPLRIATSSRERVARDTSSGFRRETTVVALSGGGETGRGEDVAYDAADHEALAEAPPFAGPDAPPDSDLAGEYTVAGFSAALDDVDLFPTGEPERETARHYRRWAFESAGLDLALRQAGRSLGDALGRVADPVRFVVSTRLGEPPTTDRVEAVLAHDPDAEFKLDPTAGWDDGLVTDLAATGAVRVLDLKGRYEGTDVDQAPDPALYRRVIEGFPDAVIEDPGVTEETRPVLEPVRDRLSWDYPITGVESVAALPWEPRWLNVKPSRFGTVESLLETIDYCEERGIALYGGGQFELAVGRDQIQALAALCYPDAPNDVAPGGYNDPTLPPGLPRSPLPAPDVDAGIA